MRKIRHIVVHHTGSDFSTMASIRATHVLQFQWKDIGYHYVFYKNGTEHVGRPEHKPGAHTKGLNHNTIAICMCGNLNKSAPTAAQLTAAAQKAAQLVKKYGLTPDDVIGHRETVRFVSVKDATKKSCPGTKTDMDVFRTWVKAYVERGT